MNILVHLRDLFLMRLFVACKSFDNLVLVPVIQLFRSVDRLAFISTVASASGAHAGAVSGTKLWLNMNCDKINDAIKFFLAHNYTTLYTILYETTLPSA